MSNLAYELTALLNKHSVENDSGTPDHILAVYLLGCLTTFEVAIKARDQWWKHEPKIGGIIPAYDYETEGLGGT